MQINLAIPSGKYIVAVSGGVDSIVLLHLLAANNCELIVAHFDHGIREDSNKDKIFVEQLASKYQLKFEFERVELGKDASENMAREKRYAFLNKIKQKQSAEAIITAHHQDDFIETGMLNLIRGTGRNGLVALKSRDGLLRPLLDIPKKDIIKYAKEQRLEWREDSTNSETKYLRNKIRQNIAKNMTDEQRKKWLQISEKVIQINYQIDQQMNYLLRRGLHKGQPVLSRQWFIMLPHAVCKEVLHKLLTDYGAKNIDKKNIDKTVILIKTLPGGKTIDLSGVKIILTKRSARFIPK